MYKGVVYYRENARPYILPTQNTRQGESADGAIIDPYPWPANTITLLPAGDLATIESSFWKETLTKRFSAIKTKQKPTRHLRDSMPCHRH